MCSISQGCVKYRSRLSVGNPETDQYVFYDVSLKDGLQKDWLQNVNRSASVVQKRTTTEQATQLEYVCLSFDFCLE